MCILDQIEEYYAAKGVNIVGYFHANERFDDYELSGVAKNIGDHIYRYFPQAPILLVCTRPLLYLDANWFSITFCYWVLILFCLSFVICS